MSNDGSLPLPDFPERCRNLAELYVNGEWLEPVAGDHREIRCPADGSLVAVVSEATRADTEKAIVAARQAFDAGTWSRTPERERGSLLSRVADLLVRDKAQFARAESLDTGKRLVEAEYDIDDVVTCFRYFAGIAGTDAGRVIDTGVENAISRVVHEPVGVCGLITPWNYPLLQTSWKVAPALVAGNTFILKPSELTPSTAILLMKALAEAGLPRASPTSFWEPARRSAPRCRSTRTWISSRSPVGSGPES